MEMLRGVVRRISKSANVSGNQQGVGTAQIVTCEIGDRPVEIWMPSVPMIEDGDEIIVAGQSKFGKLQAWEFRNLRNGTSGHWDYNIAAGIVVVLILLMFLLLACVLPIFLILHLIFIPMVVWVALEKFRIYQA